MKIYRTAFAILLVIAMIMLTSCSDGIAPIKSEEGDLNVVANVFGKPVYMEEINYLVYNYLPAIEEKYEKGSDEAAVVLKEKTEAAIKKNPAFLALCDEYGVDISSKAAKDYVSDYINGFAEELGGAEAYKAQLLENGITDHHLRYLLSIEYAKETLRQKMLDAKIIDDSDENARNIIGGDDFIRTVHIYISNDEGEDIEENRKKAEKAMEGLKNGEPFNRMIGRYSEDVFMTTTDGYYFMRGEYDEAYENAAFALSVDEYSDIIEVDGGFYIIKRLQKEQEYIDKNFESLKDRYLYVMFERVVDKKAADAVIEYTEFGKTLDFKEFER